MTITKANTTTTSNAAIPAIANNQHKAVKQP